MKSLVAIKRVVDPNVRVRLKADGSGVDTAGLKMSMNPFDEIALEEAVRLKEAGTVGEVVAVSIGSPSCQDVLRSALALGADRAILIDTGEAEVQPLAVAQLLRELVVREAPSLVIVGKQAIDDDANQTGQILAALLRWPQATFASKLAVTDGRAEVTREVDGGLQTIAVALPAVITADLRLNAPRHATLPNVMKAKKRPLETLAAQALGVDIAPRLRTLKLSAPPPRAAGVRVADVKELVDRLKAEAKVIPQ